MTATESLLPEIINDFFNKIGTFLPYRPRQSMSEVGGENGLNADMPQRPNLTDPV